LLTALAFSYLILVQSLNGGLEQPEGTRTEP
jgi:hypothetical protein